MKNHTSTFFSTLILVLFACSISACRVSEEGYGRWDADSNTLIDENEFTVVWTETGYFGRWDADQSGAIEESEWNAGRNAYMQDYNETEFGTFGDWDADGNAGLSEEEFRNRIFEVYDVDRDSTLAEPEYSAWWSTFNRDA